MALVIEANLLRLTDAHAHVNLFDGEKGAGTIILSRRSWDALGDEAALAVDGASVTIEVKAIGYLRSEPTDTAARRQTRADGSRGDL